MHKALSLLCGAVLIGWPGQAVAQSVNGFEVGSAIAAGEREERERLEAQQKKTAQDQAWYAEQAKKTRDTMTVIRAMPLVPAARNPILGKWVTEAAQRPSAKVDDFFGQMAQMGSLMCRSMLSDGVVNFRPGEWSLDDSAGDESLGPVSYRGRGSIVAILPSQGINALVFEVEGKDRLVELRTSNPGDACVLTRVPQTTTYATRPGARKRGQARK